MSMSNIEKEIAIFLENVKILKLWEQEASEPKNKFLINIAFQSERGEEKKTKNNPCFCACKTELIDFSNKFKHLPAQERKMINQKCLDAYLNRLEKLKTQVREKICQGWMNQD